MIVLTVLAAVYAEIKEIVGSISRRGWRPLIPWMFIALGAAITYRIAIGLPLPQVPELLSVLGPLVIPTLLAQWTRSVETRAGVANAPFDQGLASNGTQVA